MRSKKNHNQILHVFFIALSLAFIIPFWAIISISISNEKVLITEGYSLIPRQLDFTAYEAVFKNPERILSAYKVTIIVSCLGVVLYLIIGSMCAYPLSRLNFRFRRGITFFLFFTMLFNGGLIPYYILFTRYLHLRNTYAALILPLLGNVWYVFLMRTFFQQLPTALFESARIDGASEFSTFIRIVLPISTPVLATVGLFQLLAYWNSWFQALLFVTEKDMYPLQYLLQVMLRNIQEVLKEMQFAPGAGLEKIEVPSESVRMAMAIVAVGPMIFIFPFFQRYFVKGLTVGSVKG